MNCNIRCWRIEDAVNLAEAFSNKKILNNLRDGLPYPYTVKDAKKFITSMLDSDKEMTYAFAITIGDTASCRILEKPGFEYEGTMRKNTVKNGIVIDMKMYSKMKE